MRLRILLVALISMTVAQPRNTQRPTRAPQAQIKYHDPNGLKVNWKFFSPQTQFRARPHIQTPQPQQTEATRAEDADATQEQPQSQLLQVEEDELAHRPYIQPPSQSESQQNLNQIQYKSFSQPQPTESQPYPNQLQYKRYPAEPQPDPNQAQYGRYSATPSDDSFKPQVTYSGPQAVLYQTNTEHSQQYGQQPTSPSAPNYEPPSDRYGQQGRIVYKDEQEQQLQEPQVEHIPVPVEKLPVPAPRQLVFNKNMPREIQQLLQYQAQIPYDVIANSITYKPKTLFVPKQLPSSEAAGPYQYRAKTYYVNQGQYQDDSDITKPVEEVQNHRH
ncbi:uncharacterized protein LOC143424870 [Xylocopa sonorina]|uniref:uncharacterized protein LOC143424870 n=1 Tax=Xylocopa sonorina TaxID=1818115 RepID=UPI00403AF762